MYRTILALISVGIFSWMTVASAQMSSTNYLIRWDTISTGGSDTSTSSSFQLRDTVGNTATGDSDSSSYQMAAGYRQGVFDPLVTFDVFSQLTTSGRAATAVSGNTITAATNGLSAGDYIVLLQDQGAGQISAIGRIVSAGGGTIVVDELKDGGTAPTIDGSNDYVYLLEGMNADLDTLDAAIVSAAVIGFQVRTDAGNGYVVQALVNGKLRDGANDIDDVGDGAVTVGSEEYGGRSSDTSIAGSTFDTADTAFSTSSQDVADESSYTFQSRNFLTLKASIDGSTADGSYEQSLALIASVNF
jgi:hypothetical protein